MCVLWWQSEACFRDCAACALRCLCGVALCAFASLALIVTPSTSIAQGLECHLLTGDTWRTARAIGRQLAIRSVMAEVLPAGKATVVQEQQVGRWVTSDER